MIMTHIAIIKAMRVRMLEREITYPQLVELSGINISNLNLIMTGKRVPRIDTLVTIADALGMKIEIQ